MDVMRRRYGGSDIASSAAPETSAGTFSPCVHACERACIRMHARFPEIKPGIYMNPDEKYSGFLTGF